MGSTVLIKGAPADVPIDVLAYNLDKVFDTDEIGTFRVRELSKENDPNRRIAIDFKSAFDAFTAQSILHGYKYTWSDGEEYVLQAKIINDSKSASKDWQRIADQKHKSKSLLPYNMTSDNVKECNDMLDSKLELLKKQKLLLRTERELLLEKRKLEREYRKIISDSEDEIVVKKRKTAYKKRESSSSHRSKSPCDGSKLKLRPVRRRRSPSNARSRSRSNSRSPLRLTASGHRNSHGRSRSPNNVKSVARYVPQDVATKSWPKEYDDQTRLIDFSESPEYASRVRYKSPNYNREHESSLGQPMPADERMVPYDPFDLRYKLRRSRSPEPQYKWSEGSSSRRRSPSDGFGPRYRSRSRSRSRSRVYSRSLMSPRSPDHSRSYSHTRIPSVCSKPVRSRSPDHPSTYIRSRSPDHCSSYIRNRSPDQSRSHIRSRSPDQSSSYIRNRSPDQSRSYIRNRSPDQSRSYIRNRSPYESSSYIRHKSPDLPRSSRGRSRSPIRWPMEHSRSRARYRSRSNSPSRSRRRMSKYEAMDRSLTQSTSDKVRVEDIRDEDNPTYPKARERTITNYEIKKISKDKASEHDEEKERITNVTISIVSASEMPISEPITEEVTIKEEITVKKEVNEYEHEITDKEFKLQMNKAIREIQMESQTLLYTIAIKNNLQDLMRRSIMKTLKSILYRRLRQLKLVRFMLKDDILYEYRNLYSQRDDSLLIQKLIDQLSGPKIEVDDADVINAGQSQENADSKIWSIVDEVLQDLEMDYLADDDDNETVIIGKAKEEFNSEDFDMNDKLNIKTEDPHDTVKIIKTEPVDAITEYVEQNDSNNVNIKTESYAENEINITITVNAVRSDIKVEQINETEQKIHEDKEEIDQNEQQVNKDEQKIDQNELKKHSNGRSIPAEPKFFITIKNLLKKMKPQIYKLCGHMNMIRVLNITTYELRNRIKKIVKGKGYMKSSEITALYRKKYPINKDLEFVLKILTDIRKGVYINFEEQGTSKSTDNNWEKIITTSHNTKHGDDSDVIIVEREEVITISEDEDDLSFLEEFTQTRKVVEVHRKL